MKNTLKLLSLSLLMGSLSTMTHAAAPNCEFKVVRFIENGSCMSGYQANYDNTGACVNAASPAALSIRTGVMLACVKERRRAASGVAGFFHSEISLSVYSVQDANGVE